MALLHYRSLDWACSPLSARLLADKLWWTACRCPICRARSLGSLD